MAFLTIGAAIQNIKSKGKYFESNGRNILRSFDVWEIFLFTTREARRDY